MNGTSKNIFKSWPKSLQLIIVIFGILIFVKYTDVLLESSWSSPFKYILIPFFMPVYSLCAMPVLTFFGIAQFKSDLLFTTSKKDKLLEIHFGSLFDIICSGLLFDRTRSFRNRMLFSLVEGLLEIVDNIEDGTISREDEIIGTSYFFDYKTAKKFGFKKEPTITSHKYILMGNMVEIMFVYSMSQRRISIPKFSKFKTVKAKASDLVEAKKELNRYHSYISSRIEKI